MIIRDILAQVYDSAKKNDDTAVDFVFEVVDSYLKINKLSVVDQLICQLDLEQVSLEVALGMLTITNSYVKNKLIYRKAFYCKVIRILQESAEPIERIESLTIGLG